MLPHLNNHFSPNTSVGFFGEKLAGLRIFSFFVLSTYINHSQGFHCDISIQAQNEL
jgi:hypothetical protein